MVSVFTSHLSSLWSGPHLCLPQLLWLSETIQVAFSPLRGSAREVWVGGAHPAPAERETDGVWESAMCPMLARLEFGTPVMNTASSRSRCPQLSESLSLWCRRDEKFMVVWMRETPGSDCSGSPHDMAAMVTSMSRFPDRDFESIFFFHRSKILLAWLWFLFQQKVFRVIWISWPFFSFSFCTETLSWHFSDKEFVAKNFPLIFF